MSLGKDEARIIRANMEAGCPYARIVWNAQQGKGTHLSDHETFQLGVMDDAIQEYALRDPEDTDADSL